MCPLVKTAEPGGGRSTTSWSYLVVVAHPFRIALRVVGPAGRRRFRSSGIVRPATGRVARPVAELYAQHQQPPPPRQCFRRRTALNRQLKTRHGTGSVGHRVNGSFASSFTSGSPDHRVIILTRCETRVFPVFEKKAQDKDIKIYIFCENPSNRHCNIDI